MWHLLVPGLQATQSPVTPVKLSNGTQLTLTQVIASHNVIAMSCQDLMNAAGIEHVELKLTCCGFYQFEQIFIWFGQRVHIMFTCSISMISINMIKLPKLKKV